MLSSPTQLRRPWLKVKTNVSFWSAWGEAVDDNIHNKRDLWNRLFSEAKPGYAFLSFTKARPDAQKEHGEV